MSRKIEIALLQGSRQEQVMLKSFINELLRLGKEAVGENWLAGKTEVNEEAASFWGGISREKFRPVDRQEKAINQIMSYWLSIPGEIRERLKALCHGDEKDGDARLAYAGIYLARKVAVQTNIRKDSFLFPGDDIREFSELVGKINWTIEFSSQPDAAIVKREMLPIRDELANIYKRKTRVQERLMRNLEKCAEALLGGHYMLSSQFDLSPMDNSYVLFKSQEENPAAAGILLEFDIDHKTGRVRAESADLFGAGKGVSMDVTDWLDDPDAMTQKIREVGEREQPAMRM